MSPLGHPQFFYNILVENGGKITHGQMQPATFIRQERHHVRTGRFRKKSFTETCKMFSRPLVPASSLLRACMAAVWRSCTEPLQLAV